MFISRGGLLRSVLGSFLVRAKLKGLYDSVSCEDKGDLKGY